MNSIDADESARRAAMDFARSLVPIGQAALGNELLGIYLIGSLAHGGFSRRYSDIDVAVVSEVGISPPTNVVSGASLLRLCDGLDELE
jgi:hypothetical protein